MEFDVTILSKIMEWGGLQMTGGILAGTAFETFKNTSLYDSLKSSLNRFCDKEDEFETFITAVHNNECANPFELPNNIDEWCTTESSTGNSLELGKILKAWLEENRNELQQFIGSLENGQPYTEYNIGSQNAKTVINIGNNKGPIYNSNSLEAVRYPKDLTVRIPKISRDEIIGQFFLISCCTPFFGE